MTPSTPAPTDAGALAEAAEAIEYAIRTEGVFHAYAASGKMIVAALRNSAPKETQGDEPVAWLVNRQSDPTFPRLFLLRANVDLLLNYANVGPLPTVTPLYAASQQSPRLEREGIVRQCADVVGNMRQSEAGLFDAKHSGQRGCDRADALYDAYVAIAALLLPDTTVVSSTLWASCPCGTGDESCPDPDGRPLCALPSNLRGEPK